MSMWNPVRDKTKEALGIIKCKAEYGIKQELKKIERKVNKLNKDLFEMNKHNSTIKKRSSKRSNLDLALEEKERYDLALKLIDKIVFDNSEEKEDDI